MQSFVIIGSTESAKKKASEEAKKLKANLYYENIKKISEARDFIKNTSFTYTSPVVYFLEQFDNASIETQNALLKTIEEPNQNLYIYLHADNLERLLPTIQSRVSVITTTAEYNSNQEQSKFFERSESEMIEHIYSIKKRDDAINFVSNLHKSALKNEKYKTIEYIEETKSRLNQNANPSLQLINLVVKVNN